MPTLLYCRPWQAHLSFRAANQGAMCAVIIKDWIGGVALGVCEWGIDETPQGRAGTARLLLNPEPIFQPHFVRTFFIAASTAVRDQHTFPATYNAAVLWTVLILFQDRLWPLITFHVVSWPFLWRILQLWLNLQMINKTHSTSQWHQKNS